MRIANLKKAVWGLMAFASTLVCVMDCYPLIPAVYGVYCLSSGHTIIFYIGLIIGMGYFISIPSICKYLFIIAVIYFGERLFVRKSSKNGCLTTAVVAACATAVMNLSVTFLGRPDTDEIVLSVAESLVVFSMAFALCRACEYLRALEHNENPVIAGLLPDREEAFATAVSGLSGIISTANVMAVKCTADKIPDESEKIQLEVTGRLCACCEGCSVCWTSGTSISDSIKMLADAVRKRMKTEEIVQNRYVDGCPHYTRMVEAATEAFARIELNEAWYRRLTENRRVIATQLDAMAELMDSWCRAEKCIDKKRRLRLTRVYVYTKEAGIQVENAHIYENARQQVCIKADVCTRIDGGIEISKYVQAVSRAMGVKLRQAHGTVSIISDERTSIVLYEENQFYALSGVATKKKTGSQANGDSCSMFTLALVLAMIWIIDVLKKKMQTLPKFLWYLVSFIIVAVTCLIAMNLSLDYDSHAVLIGYFLYLFHDRPIIAIPFNFASMYKEPWALLGFGLMLTYNGKRGKQNKLVNYLFYPVHLLILGILRMCLGI